MSKLPIAPAYCSRETLLEAGCTDAEVAAITGQSRQMVEHYARLVNQERLARTAILKWEAQNG